MSQRDSGYARKERDLYETPQWVTESLLPHIPERINCAWECAAGGWQMVNVLSRHLVTYGTDIVSDESEFSSRSSGVDFLAQTRLPQCAPNAIITNPPYELATEFCEHALRLMEPVGGFVAMLLRTDFDHAKSRSHLFRDCPAFAKKLVLTKRIVWFEPEPGAKGKSPSFNHAWFCWDWTHEGAPILAYGP